MIGAEVVLAAGSEQSAKSSCEGSHPAALISAGQVKSKCVANSCTLAACCTGRETALLQQLCLEHAWAVLLFRWRRCIQTLSLNMFRGMQFAPGMLPLCMRAGGNLMETAMENPQISFSYVLWRKQRI